MRVMETPNYIINKALRPDNKKLAVYSGKFALMLVRPISGRKVHFGRVGDVNEGCGTSGKGVARPGGGVCGVRADARGRWLEAFAKGSDLMTINRAGREGLGKEFEVSPTGSRERWGPGRG